MAIRKKTDRPSAKTKPEKPTRLFRTFEIDRAKVDAEKRTLELAFSSETPVERWWGEQEILSHEKGDCDLERLNDGAPLLLNHNTDEQIGVVESARIDLDKVGRAVVRFGNSPLANEIFDDVVNGIRRKISFGYEHNGLIKTLEKKGEKPRAWYRWMAYEVSIVPVPADNSVGVGRAEDAPPVDSPEDLNVDEIANQLTQDQKLRMKILLDPAPANAPAGGGPLTVDEPAVRADEAAKTKKAVADAFKVRNKEICDIADTFITEHGRKNGGKLADRMRALQSEALQTPDMSIADFKARCLTEVVNAKPAQPVMIEELANGEDIRSYSILRGIQSCIKRKQTVPDGVEGEIHQEVLNRAKQDGGLGYEAEGFQVPANAPMRVTDSRQKRDMQATLFNAGGAFVPTQLLVPIIELLRNRMILEKLGIRRMAGLQGNIVIPRQEAAGTAYSVSEIGLLTASQQILGQIALTPKRVGATQTYSKQFVMQSTPDAEAFMRDDLFTVIALLWDRLGLNGQGAASEPLGIINTPGVGSITFGGAPTYADIVEMETQIEEANVIGGIAYVTTPRAKGTLKITPAALTGATVVSGTSNALWTGSLDGQMNGYPAYATNQVPNHLLIAGAFNQLIHAIWGGLDVVVDQFTQAARAEIVLTINTWGDYAVRHPQAFVVSADAANQSA